MTKKIAVFLEIVEIGAGEILDDGLRKVTAYPSYHNPDNEPLTRLQSVDFGFICQSFQQHIE